MTAAVLFAGLLLGAITAIVAGAWALEHDLTADDQEMP